MVRSILGRGAPGGILALALLVATALPARAQDRQPFTVGIGFLNTQPLGGLRTGPGVGVGLSGSLALERTQRLRLRGEARLASYGSDSREVCLSQTVGCWIQVDITTRYSAIYAGVGPELAVPVLGSELAVAVTGGIGYFGVQSSIKGIDEASDGFGDTSHFDDTFFAWSAGGEWRVPVSRAVAVAVGAHYQHNGRASYVPDGGVTENPDGTLNVAAITSDANLMAITLGISIHPFRD